MCPLVKLRSFTLVCRVSRVCAALVTTVTEVGSVSHRWPIPPARCLIEEHPTYAPDVMMAQEPERRTGIAQFFSPIAQARSPFALQDSPAVEEPPSNAVEDAPTTKASFLSPPGPAFLSSGVAGTLTPHGGPSDPRPRRAARKKVPAASKENAPPVNLVDALKQRAKDAKLEEEEEVAEADEVDAPPMGASKLALAPSPILAFIAEQPEWVQVLARFLLCIPDEQRLGAVLSPPLLEAR